MRPATDGAQIFRQDDKPKYRRAFSVACAVLAVGLTLAIVRFIDDHRRKRKNLRETSSRSSTSDVEHFYEEKPKAAPPSEIQPAPIIIDAIRSPSISKTVI